MSESIVGRTKSMVDTDIFFQTENSNNENEEPINEGNTVSGMKIVEDVDTTGIDDLLGAINNSNKATVEEEERLHEEKEKQKQKEIDEAIANRQKELLERRAEEEAKLREQKRLEEEELERQRLEEEAKRKARRITRDNSENGDNVITSTIKDGVKNGVKGLGNINLPKFNLKGKHSDTDVDNVIPTSIEDITNIEGTNEDNKQTEENKPEINTPVETKESKEKKEKPKREKKEKEQDKEDKKSLFGIRNKDKREKNNKDNEDVDWKEKATTDELTGLKNIAAYDLESKDFSLYGNIIFVDVNNLKYINDNIGHEAGDILLKEVSKALKKVFPDKIYRIGGDEFIIYTEDKEGIIEKKIQNIEKSLDRCTKEDKSGIIYTCSIGLAIGDGEKSISELKIIADKDMYEKKETYRQAHPEFNIRSVPKNEEVNLDGKDWKSLAMIDQTTKLYNKLALGMNSIEKTDTLAMIRLSGFASFKRAESDRQLSLISELIRNNLNDNSKAFYIENGVFLIIYKDKKTTLEAIKTKARSISINIEATSITGNNSDIDKIIDILSATLDGPKTDNTLSYDDRLSYGQRKMKETVKENHEIVQEDEFEQILTAIQKKSSDIISIFMTSKDFNTLFIFFDVYDFLENIYQIQSSIDFSYLYAVYPGGALYYGADEYSNEISDLFQKIADGLQNGTVTSKDIQKIEGINIFERIYVQ